MGAKPMKTIRLVWIVALYLCLRVVLVAQAAPRQAHLNKASETAPSFAFEPLDKWKAAVLAGDKSALAGFYATSPAATAKTPQGETQDPAEEPTFWSSLRSQGLDRLDVKVLEVKTLQPGVMAFVSCCGLPGAGNGTSRIRSASPVEYERGLAPEESSCSTMPMCSRRRGRRGAPLKPSALSPRISIGKA